MEERMNRPLIWLSTKSTLLALVCATLFLTSTLLLTSNPAKADRNFSKFDIVLNKSSGAVNVAGLKTKNYLQELAKSTFVYLDLKVLLDGSDEDAVLQSTEEADRRTSIDCQPGRYGPLPMVDGMEYYLPTSYEGKKISATFYPGTRSQYTFNDVACTFDTRIQKRAVFHLRGFFAVVSNTYADGVSFQLRPIAPTPDEIGKVLN